MSDEAQVSSLNLIIKRMVVIADNIRKTDYADLDDRTATASKRVIEGVEDARLAAAALLLSIKNKDSASMQQHLYDRMREKMQNAAIALDRTELPESIGNLALKTCGEIDDLRYEMAE